MLLGGAGVSVATIGGGLLCYNTTRSQKAKSVGATGTNHPDTATSGSELSNKSHLSQSPSKTELPTNLSTVHSSLPSGSALGTAGVVSSSGNGKDGTKVEPSRGPAITETNFPVVSNLKRAQRATHNMMLREVRRGWEFSSRSVCACRSQAL